MDGFAPDGRWFGALPETILSVDGDYAERLIPKIRSVIENYKFQAYGDYHPWPGPNSNTFVQAALDSVPELNAVLPPTAIGKDYPYDGEWYGLTLSRTGIFLNLAGYFGLKIGWVEGVELNLLSGVIGIDLRRPAIKLPAMDGWGCNYRHKKIAPKPSEHEEQVLRTEVVRMPDPGGNRERNKDNEPRIRQGS